MDDFEICRKPCCQPPQSDCIIAHKIFDQCRIQICLTSGIIGPARAACGIGGNGNNCCCKPAPKGEIIVPPPNAVNVTITDLCLTNITVISKTPSAFRNGFWDVVVKFTFTYILKFYDAESNEIFVIPAYSTYTTTLSLFGGEDMCVTMYNELYADKVQNGPFVAVEGNAVALASCLSYPCPPNLVSPQTQIGNCDCTVLGSGMLIPVAVNVTIGLFAVVKLFRFSNMCVENHGDCMPDDCSAVSPETLDPCTFFDSLDFPSRLFAPKSFYRPSTDCPSHMPLPSDNCCNGR
jgi:hypothetical protein